MAENVTVQLAFHHDVDPRSMEIELERSEIEKLKEKFEDWKGEIDQYEFIASSNYGACFLAYITLDGEKRSFVVKHYYKHYIPVQGDTIRFDYHRNLVNILHSNPEREVSDDFVKERSDELNKLIGDLTFFGRGYVIMRFQEQTLESYLEKRKSSNHLLTDEEFCYIMYGVLEGSIHLHSRWICHRNLHMANIFVEPRENQGRVRIGGFRSSLDFSSQKRFLITKETTDEDSSSFFENCVSDLRNHQSVDGNERIPPELRIINDEQDKKTEVLDFSKCDVYSLGKLGQLFFTEGYMTSEPTLEEETRNYIQEKLLPRMVSDETKERMSLKKASTEFRKIIESFDGVYFLREDEEEEEEKEVEEDEVEREKSDTTHQQHEEELEDLKNMYEEEIKELKNSHDLELEKMRTQMISLEEEQNKNNNNSDAQQQLENLNEQHEEEMEEVKKSFESELANMRSSLEEEEKKRSLLEAAVKPQKVKNEDSAPEVKRLEKEIQKMKKKMEKKDTEFEEFKKKKKAEISKIYKEIRKTRIRYHDHIKDLQQTSPSKRRSQRGKKSSFSFDNDNDLLYSDEEKRTRQRMKQRMEENEKLIGLMRSEISTLKKSNEEFDVQVKHLKSTLHEKSIKSRKRISQLESEKKKMRSILDEHHRNEIQQTGEEGEEEEKKKRKKYSVRKDNQTLYSDLQKLKNVELEQNLRIRNLQKQNLELTKVEKLKLNSLNKQIRTLTAKYNRSETELRQSKTKMSKTTLTMTNEIKKLKNEIKIKDSRIKSPLKMKVSPSSSSSPSKTVVNVTSIPFSYSSSPRKKKNIVKEEEKFEVVKNLRKDMRTQSNQIQNLRMKIDTKEKEIERLKQEQKKPYEFDEFNLGGKEGVIVHLKKLINDRDRRVQGLEKAIQNVRMECKYIRGRALEMEIREKNMEDKFRDSLVAIKKHKETIGLQNMKITRLRAENTTMKKKIDDKDMFKN